MKTLIVCATATLMLTACGTDKKTTVVERPIVVAPNAAASPTPASVESMCKNGYDNSSRSCY